MFAVVGVANGSFSVVASLCEMFSGWLVLGAIVGVKSASRSCRKVAIYVIWHGGSFE